jgi:cytochrome c oxidase assembly protein subunit 15
MTPELGSPLAPEAQRIRGGDVLASGFGMTVAAWLVAYISRMPLVNAPGQITVFAMLTMVFIGGILTARFSARGVLAAALAGAVSGLLDILIVGSVLHDVAKGGPGAAAPTGSVAPAAALWMSGSILLNALIAGAGGLFGRLFPSPRRGEVRWTNVFALVLVVATLPLITAGGLVTAFRAGLAVPDWPQSYGYNMFLFPLSQMQSNHGNFYEHAHRLMGSLVGLTSLTLAIYIALAETRGWVKGLAWAIFAAVCVQGILGGTRVTEKSTTLAITHGVFAQMVFAAMACLVAITSRSFARTIPVTRESAGSDRFFSSLLVCSLLVQLILGALLRHTNSMVMLHILMAATVAMIAVATGFRAWGLYGDVMPVRRTGVAVMLMVCMQLLLGVIALAMRSAPSQDPTVPGAFLTTAHQANGAALLAVAAVLWVWVWRLLIPGRIPAPEPEVAAPDAHVREVMAS